MPETASNYEALTDRALDIISEVFPDMPCGATQWQPADINDEDANLAIVFLKFYGHGRDVGDCQLQLMTHVLDQHRIPILAQGIRNYTRIAIVDSQQVDALGKLAWACSMFGSLIKWSLHDMSPIDREFVKNIVSSAATLQKQKKRIRK